MNKQNSYALLNELISAVPMSTTQINIATELSEKLGSILYELSKKNVSVHFDKLSEKISMHLDINNKTYIFSFDKFLFTSSNCGIYDLLATKLMEVNKNE